MPSMSVVVAYFFPVRGLVAVTATPGSGTPLAFTVPRMVPPCAASGAAGATGAAVAGAAGVAAAGAAGVAAAGAAGAAVAGACVVAAPVPCARAAAPKSPAQTSIAAPIANPPTSLIRFTRSTNHAPFSRPYRTQRTSKPPRLVATDI